MEKERKIEIRFAFRAEDIVLFFSFLIKLLCLNNHSSSFQMTMEKLSSLLANLPTKVLRVFSQNESVFKVPWHQQRLHLQDFLKAHLLLNVVLIQWDLPLFPQLRGR